MNITASNIWNAYTARSQTPNGYSTALEWNGHPQRRHVVRHNGQWCGSFNTKRGALDYIRANGGQP